MWNVSGVSGAAPVWYEIMNYLHRHGDIRKIGVPPNVIQKEIVSSTEETEKSGSSRGHDHPLQIKSSNNIMKKLFILRRVRSSHLTLTFPLICRRSFLFRTPEDKKLRRLNETAIGEPGKTAAWSPTRGKYNLQLTDMQGKIIDFVNFEVRGVDQAFSEEDGEKDYGNP